VFGIAYRQYLMHLSRHKVEILPLDDCPADGEVADPNDLLEATEKAYRVRDAVDRLPEIYREVITLVHLQGLTYREASSVLDIPIGTVKSRANSAFNILRNVLEENEVSDCDLQQSESISG
jgi:RNA polymerase sigma-70 factor (ECF subfamily)